MKFTRPHLWGPIAVATAISTAGIVAAVTRISTVDSFTRDIASIQTASAAESLEALVEAAKSEAQLLATGGIIGKAGNDERYSSKIVETYLVSGVEIVSGRATVLRLLRGSDGSPLFAVGTQFPMVAGLSAGQGATAFFPAQQPTHILMFEVGPGGVAICSAVSIASLVSHAVRATSGYLELSLDEPLSRKRLGSTAGWGTSEATLDLAQTIAPPASLILRARPSNLLLSRVGGTHVVAILLATLALSGLSYFVLYRGQIARQKLRKVTTEGAMSAGRYATNLDDMLSSVSEASGVMFFLLRPNARVDLFGPWSEIDELGSTSLALPEINQAVVGGDAVSKSILAALAAKASWVYTYRTKFEDETELYQAAGAPVYAPDGAFLGLLGVRTNVSEVVRAMDSASKTDAIRTGQEHVLQDLSDTLEEDRHLISRALTCLANSLSKGDAAGVAHWMETSTAAGDRIEGALQAAVVKIRAAPRPTKPALGPEHRGLVNTV